MRRRAPQKNKGTTPLETQRSNKWLPWLSPHLERKLSSPKLSGVNGITSPVSYGVFNWEKSQVLDAVLGERVAIARKTKNEENWFIGAITDEKARNIPIKLDFLSPNHTYVATLYTDPPGTSYLKNSEKVVIEQMMVSHQSSLELELAPGGGAALNIRAVPQNHPGTNP